MRSVLFAAVLIFSTPEFSGAMEEGNFRLGAQAGHVGLLSDVGGEFGNAIGYGIIAGYHATDEMVLEFGYTVSTHGDLKRSGVDVGVAYYTGSYDALYVHLVGGAAFIDHSFELQNEDFTSTGFNLFGGVGADFEIGERFLAGLQMRYYKAFETTVELNDSSKAKAIQDSVTVLLRLNFLM